MKKWHNPFRRRRYLKKMIDKWKVVEYYAPFGYCTTRLYKILQAYETQGDDQIRWITLESQILSRAAGRDIMHMRRHNFLNTPNKIVHTINGDKDSSKHD